MEWEPTPDDIKIMIDIVMSGTGSDWDTGQRLLKARDGEKIALYQGPCDAFFPHADGVIVKVGRKYLLNGKIMFLEPNDDSYRFYEHPLGAAWTNFSIKPMVKEASFFLNGKLLYRGPAEQWRVCLDGVLIKKDGIVYLNGKQPICAVGNQVWHAHPLGVALVKKQGKIEVYAPNQEKPAKEFESHSDDKFSAKYGHYSRWRKSEYFSDQATIIFWRDGEDMKMSRSGGARYQWQPHPDGVLEIDNVTTPIQMYLNGFLCPPDLPISLRPFVWQKWDFAREGINCANGQAIIYCSPWPKNPTFVYYEGDYSYWRSHPNGILLEEKGSSEKEKIISFIAHQ